MSPKPISQAHFPAFELETDNEETKDWLDSLSEVIFRAGIPRAEFLMDKLIEYGRKEGGRFHTRHTTPYRNTIPVGEQSPYPGDLGLEARITAIHRWNALMMVMRANMAHAELGGHIATYASIADLFEVGFNHFFTAPFDDHPGDLVYFQPHAAPGIYARAFLEGRLIEENLIYFRREVSGGIGNGLSSYPHPTLMPDFWQFPTGSMGLGLLSAIYQARFQRYLENRELIELSTRKIWAFVGDGEMDEPESLAGISLAAREQLDNLTLVVNCNLQRLDGPVRGNGNIVQELETLFAGAGWNVIKCLWGSNWDVLFARDKDGWILKRMSEAIDGEFQKLSATDGMYNRENFFSKYKELEALVANMSDTEIDMLQRGGHDPIKIYSAYQSAMLHKGQPTVILAQTTKGYGMGTAGQGLNSSHQTKKLTKEALIEFRDRFAIQLSDSQVSELQFLRPDEESPEMRYLQERRSILGGYLPARRQKAKKIRQAQPALFSSFHNHSGDREISTTMVMVRLLTKVMQDSEIGRRIVPIVADEARTFGMQDMFRKFGIYSPWGQNYIPQDVDQLAYYREEINGQILEEGITEAGSMGSWIAAGTAYSHSNQPMIPCYIFYSIFGFQRVADLIWNASDCKTKGFLLGATAGRTTLSGEGVQHEDGQSHLYAATFPTCRAFDPAFGYELAVIMEEGIREMMCEDNAGFYYITLYNENYRQPSMSEKIREGILRGIYLLQSSKKQDAKKVKLLGSGSILQQVIEAAILLDEQFGVAANVYSVTSFGELRKEAINCERWNMLNPESDPRMPYITKCLASIDGPVIAVTDYVRAYPELVRAWVKDQYKVLGTDGFGRSDTRVTLRDFFEIDARYIALTALTAIVEEGKLERSALTDAIDILKIDTKKPNPMED